MRDDFIDKLFMMFKHNQDATNITNKEIEFIEKEVDENDGNKLFILKYLTEHKLDELNQMKEFAIKESIFSKKEFDDAIERLTEMNDSEEKEEEVKKEVPIPTITETRHEDNQRIRTHEEIRALIKSWANMYTSVPGNCLPRDDNNNDYVQYQLKRFIDSGGSDFILETQKQNWKIYYMIKFKINGTHIVQDKTELAYPSDESPENRNNFFESVRTTIWQTLANMNADSKHTMQDSSFWLEYRGKTRDFRISAMPTRCWAKRSPYPRYATRLTSDGDSIDFEKIELLPFMKWFYHELINGKQAGVNLITGPTGSGKTTTIYALLNQVDKIALWVLSIEKPIESQIHGLNQTEEDAVERSKWERYTNKEWLKWILRQALDLIFIGEMRDAEETQECIKAGLIWNKLISTFHTNSSIDTILRLLEEWVSRNAIGNGVKKITAQRLIPKICPHCSVEDPNKEQELKRIKKLFNRSQAFFRRELKKVLRSLSDEDFEDVSMLEIAITDNIRTLSPTDIEDMMELLDDNLDKFQKISWREKQIEFLLELYSEYPNVELRKEFEWYIEQANFRTVNPKGCEHENCVFGYMNKQMMIVEWLRIDSALKRYIQDPETKIIDIDKFLWDKWFITMKMYGYLLAVQWLVSLDSVKEVVEE